MRFINLTKQTVELSDINLSIPYLEDESSQNIDLELVKKSKNFRTMIALGQFKIVDCGNTFLEKALLQKNNKKNDIFNSKIITSTNAGVNLDKINVKLKGHFYDAGGFAKVNRNLAEGLTNNGINVSIDPVSKNLNHLSQYEINKLHQIASPLSNKFISIDSMIPSFSGNSHDGKYKILYTTLESYSIPKQFITSISQYNEIWTPSDFCKDIMLKNGIKKPIFVFPNSFDTNMYNESIEPFEFNPKLKEFIFISVFGWSWRKGWDVLLKSYIKEFSSEENVSLLIVSRYQNKGDKNNIIKKSIKEYINKYGADKSPPHITKYSDVIPEENMASIYRSCNAFCLFSRGEGFGNPYVEASLCGLPVIGTNCSGQKMFLNKQNSTLVDIDSIETVPNGVMHIHYWDGQKMPKLTSENFIQECQKSLRFVYDNYNFVKSKNKILSSFVADNYNIKSISNKISDRINYIWSKIV